MTEITKLSDTAEVQAMIDVEMIANQEMHLQGITVNIHDIKSIVVDAYGEITGHCTIKGNWVGEEPASLEQKGEKNMGSDARTDAEIDAQMRAKELSDMWAQIVELKAQVTTIREKTIKEVGDSLYRHFAYRWTDAEVLGVIERLLRGEMPE